MAPAPGPAHYDHDEPTFVPKKLATGFSAESAIELGAVTSALNVYIYNGYVDGGFVNDIDGSNQVILPGEKSLSAVKWYAVHLDSPPSGGKGAAKYTFKCVTLEVVMEGGMAYVHGLQAREWDTSAGRMCVGGGL